MNKLIWLFFALFVAKIARYLNNPISSKNIEMIVIEKNKAKILRGLMLLEAVNWLNTSFIGAKEKANNITAPNKAIIQYVSSLIFPILICGKNMIDRVINRNVIIEIIKVAIIKPNINYLPFLQKGNNNNLVNYF